MKMTRKESDLLYRAAIVAMNSGEIQQPHMEPIQFDDEEVLFDDDEEVLFDDE